jgi:uncharacterized membrane protein YqjE
MLQDSKSFASVTAGPIPGSEIFRLDLSSGEAAELREQDAALAAMLSHISLLVLALWFFGLSGLVAWALASAALAGMWVLYTIRGIRGVGDV